MGKLLHLQGLRGLAICAVICFHYFPQYFPNGYLGVDLFFVLSGYLMSMMLSKNETIGIKIIADFLYRRLKRIAPLYYFILFLTTVVVYFAPCTEVRSNLVSSYRAAWLVTNINWESTLNYFEKLGVSHDLFTHTWSLCLEIQFYLLFPFIWWFQMVYPLQQKMVLLHILSGISFATYLLVSERTAFNNMFCRIWQFLLGNMVFCLEEFKENKQEDYEKVPLMEELEEGEKVPLVEELEEEKELQESQTMMDESNDWIFASLSLWLLVYSVITEQHLTSNFSRLTITVTSVILIYFGRDFSLLENKTMVFLGEVSYSWYLVHWPMVILQKIYDHTSMPEMILGALASLLVSILVHYLIEKQYLMWKKPAILAVVITFLLASHGSRIGCELTRIQACLVAPPTITDFHAMSKEAIKEYNYEIIMHDIGQLANENKGCVYNPPRSGDFDGTCRFENNKIKNNRTIAVIGNSWTANSSPIVFEECSPYFENVFRAAFTACEVMKEEKDDFCPQREKVYFELVERVRPEYLFIIERYVYFGLKRTEEDWKEIIQTAKDRLAYLSKLVSKKIFVIHTYPVVKIADRQMNEAMDHGTPIGNSWDYSEEFHMDMTVAQKKLDEVLTSCEKCEQFDYTPKFMVNGTFYPYDPDHFVVYFTYGLHLTLPALEKVRPIFTEICQKIGKE